MPRNSGGVCGNVREVCCCWGERKSSENNNRRIGGFGDAVRLTYILLHYSIDGFLHDCIISHCRRGRAPRHHELSPSSDLTTPTPKGGPLPTGNASASPHSTLLLTYITPPTAGQSGKCCNASPMDIICSSFIYAYSTTQGVQVVTVTCASATSNVCTNHDEDMASRQRVSCTARRAVLMVP